MNNLEELNSKIKLNIENLDILPKNNKKNINIYIKKLEELKKEAEEYQEKIIREMEKRLKKATSVEKNPEIDVSLQKITNNEGVLYLLNDIDTSYEKMDLDRAMFNLKHYYKKNLEIVNETILYCIKKFEEVGIELELSDFDYSEYVQQYLNVFFYEMEGENINSNRIKSKFEEIYWRCPELIIHIVLNIRYLYEKNKKEIDKYYEKQKRMLIKNFTPEEIMERFVDLKKQLNIEISSDKATIINKFISGELNIKDYKEKAIIDVYSKLISNSEIDLKDINKMDEIDLNIEKLLHTLYEYKEYLQFKFIIDDVKKIYQEKDKYKNAYIQTKKEIDKKEKKRISLNSKINKKGIFQKSNEKHIDQMNELIVELKQNYKELDKNKVYDKIAKELNNNSTLKDVLTLASCFYEYLFVCIRNNNKDMEEQEIEKVIADLKAFLLYPYNTIINNIKILEEKDIMIIIKDRYRLLDINILKEDLNEENLDSLIEIAEKITIAHNIRKNKIDLEEIEMAFEYKKILNK